MRLKDMGLALAFVAVLVFGVIVGYQLKPSVDVRVPDPTKVEKVPTIEIPDDTFKGLGHEEFLKSVTDEVESLKPVGKIGPFSIYVNPKTNYYMISEDDGRSTTVIQYTKDGQTTLSLIGKRQEVSVDLHYDKTTGKRLRSIYQTNKDGGLTAPTKWIYYDNDGDGQFEEMVDSENGIAYKLKGLQWVAFSRQNKRNTEKTSSPKPDASGRT